jgi:hypothetical protein
MDLSSIPEPLRSRIEEQLARLPAQVRGNLEQKLAKLPADQLEAVLKKTSPMLDRMASSAGGRSVDTSAKPPRRTGTGIANKTGSTTGQGPATLGVFDQTNHYGNTVKRGDRETPPMFVIMFAVACALVFARVLGWL